MVILHYLLKTKISLFAFEDLLRFHFACLLSFLRNAVLFKGPDVLPLRYPMGPMTPMTLFLWLFSLALPLPLDFILLIGIF